MRNRRLMLWLALLASPLGACNPKDLDSAVDKAPIRSVKRPGGFSASDFGRVIATLGPDKSKPTVAGRLLVAGTSGSAVSVVEFDAAGKVTNRVVGPGPLGELGGNPITSAVQIDDPSTPAGSVLLGVAKYDGEVGRYFILSLNADFTVRKGPAPLNMSVVHRFGLAAAVGNVSGLDAQDYVVLSEGVSAATPAVHLFEDAATATAKEIVNLPECEARLDTSLPDQYRDQRSVVVADLVGGNADEIAVGLPKSSGLGGVMILRKNDDMTAPHLACPLILAAPAGTYEGRSRFGQQIAAGDFNGDGQKDLLVGAPPDRAFIYYGPLPDTMMAVSPNVTITAPGGDAGTAKEFGATVAAINVDGMGGDEAVVGDAALIIGNAVGAGQVVVYSGDMGMPVVSLKDLKPDTNEQFGLSAVGMSFCPAGTCPAGNRPVLVVGGGDEIFAFFKIGSLAPDPRQFP